jgi:hypothetical protein
MADYVNDNAHPIRVNDSDGVLRRIRSGEVVSASGKFADRLKSTNGVRSATKEDVKAHTAAVEARSGAARGPTPEHAQADAVREARREVGALTVSGPNSVVIGDDQAPHGPGSGTVTTKQAVAAKTKGHDPHFAPNEAHQVGPVEGDEATVGGATVPSGREVHNSQVANAERTEEAASALAELAGSGDDES